MNLITGVIAAIALLVGYLIGARKKAAAPAAIAVASGEEILQNAAVRIIETSVSLFLSTFVMEMKAVSAADVKMLMEQKYKEQLSAIRQACILLTANDGLSLAILKASGLKFTEEEREQFNNASNQYTHEQSAD
jgi:putative Mn2+ efflux pump MntP